MGTVRREEHTEIVNTQATDDGAVHTSTDGPVRASVHEAEILVSDPYAGRRELAFRLQQAIYLLFTILEVLLGIRFALSLFGANRGAAFARFVYGVTRPFLAPFAGLFGTPSLDGSVFEWNALIALVVYALLGWVLVQVVWLALGDTRRSVRTTSSHTDTNVR